MMVTWVSIVRSLAPVFHLHRSGRGFEPVFVPSSRVLSVYSYSPSIGTGSNVTRLQKSIELFHAHRASTSQKIDDTYCAFVWAVLARQPNVRVGVVPEDASTEVYIAPQNSAKRKAKAKGEEIVEAAPVVLQVIPDAAIRTLDELKRDYGENLRISVDPDTIFKALTGSHIRVSCLWTPPFVADLSYCRNPS